MPVDPRGVAGWRGRGDGVCEVIMRLIDTGFYRKNIVVAEVRRRYDRHLFFCRILRWFGLAY